MQSILHLTPNELATLGYKDLSLISENEDFRTYRAHKHDGQSVLIKTPSTVSYPAKPDAMSIIKAQHLISAEMAQERLGETLLHVIMENTGALKGHLYIAPDSELYAVANGEGQIEISRELPSSATWDIDTLILSYVKQTQESVFLENTLRDAGKFSDANYLARTHPKSVLCQPILLKSKLLGAIYLENNLEQGAFGAEHQAALGSLATQAAISLENARRYSHLRKDKAMFHTLVQNIQAAIIVHDAETQILSANTMAQDLLGLSQAQLLGKTAIDPAWHLLREDGSVMPHEEYPVNRVLTSRTVLQNYVVGIDRPDRKEPVWALVNGIPMFNEADSIQQVIVNFTDITEWKKAQQQLVTSEQLFRTLVENSPDHIARYDLKLRRTYLNPAIQKLFQLPPDQVLSKTSKVSSPLNDPERYMANLQKVIDTAHECSDEISFRTPQGELRWASTRFAPEFNIEGKVESVLVISNDITEQRLAESERLEYLRLLESLDRINRVFQTEGDMEKIMNRALKEVLDIFDCDRAYLIYPCDPEAETWSVPLESTRPEYPGAGLLGAQPMPEDLSAITRALLESDHPLQIGPGGHYSVPAFARDELNVRSVLAMKLQPRTDKPWHYGIQQCSHKRTWSDQEVRLFEEIGHRLSDGLNSLLDTRNLRESEERFRQVYENSPISIWEEDFSAVKSRLDELNAQHDDLEAHLLAHPEVVKTLAGMVRVVNVNSATLELHEAGSKEELYEGLPKTFIAESYDAFRRELIAIAEGKTEMLFDGTVQTLSGKRREVSISFSVCPGYEKNLNKVFVSLFDITQRKQAEESMRLAASVFSTSQEGILISDADNRIIDINPAFTRLTGYSREEAMGKDPGFLSAGRQNHAFYAEMWQSINATGEWQGEIWNRRKSGEVYPELLSIVAVRDEEGQLQHFVGAFSDISMLKQHEEDLDRIAHYDMLTSVPNRRLLRDRLEQAIAHTRRHGGNLAVCYLDLDGFKPINDQYGHEGGDRMLIEIARRLESMSRGEDTVSRLGGDEFVLLWNDIDSEADCVRALERILDKVSQPMLLENEPVSVSASIGVTLFPDDDVDADSLLRHADHAMYTAKQLGKNRYQIFDARLERQISAQAELLAMVARGLDRKQFELYYQPKVDYPARTVVGVEALLRWNDPILGLVSPKEFLSLIENDTLAFRMGRWVMEEAVRQAKCWDKQGIKLPISINIFPRHLKSRTFIDDLHNAIEKYWPQMPENRLLMEIIETSDLEELAPIEEVIKECLTMGVSFSLDDFGTGYSSLVYLRQLSIEEIKIDQSFVRDMLEDPNDEAIVVGVISLGRAFNLRVVAEGVESSQQAQYLVDLGCTIVQGYGLGRPMPTYAFQKWYADYLANELKLCHR